MKKSIVLARYIFNRVLLYTGAILLALWTLAPIYLIALAAFSTKNEIYTYPKPLLPVNFSTETMEYFINIKGIPENVMNSVVVALLTIVFSLFLGAPGGYALARFRFRGKQSHHAGVF